MGIWSHRICIKVPQDDSNAQLGLGTGKSHGQRSLVGFSPWGRKESDTIKWLHFHFSLSCIGEGNGNPLQCSCLENPRDGGAWWASDYGVAQSRTQLKRLSSSSSSIRWKIWKEFILTHRDIEDILFLSIYFLSFDFPKTISINKYWKQRDYWHHCYVSCLEFETVSEFSLMFGSLASTS